MQAAATQIAIPREILERALAGTAGDVVLPAEVRFRMVAAHGARRPAYDVRVVAPEGR
jgi:hypothetical protein